MANKMHTRRPTRRARRRSWARLTMLAALVAAAVGAAGNQRPAAAPPRATTYRVQPGDSLWRLAGQLPEPGDRRSAVWLLSQLNALSSNHLDPGQRLLLPADGASQRAAWRNPAAWRRQVLAAPPATPAPAPAPAAQPLGQRLLQAAGPSLARGS